MDTPGRLSRDRLILSILCLAYVSFTPITEPAFFITSQIQVEEALALVLARNMHVQMLIIVVILCAAAMIALDWLTTTRYTVFWFGFYL